MQPLLERIGNHLFNSTRARAPNSRLRRMARRGGTQSALPAAQGKIYPGRRILQREGHMLGDRLNYQVTDGTLLLGTSGLSGAATHIRSPINLDAGPFVYGRSLAYRSQMRKPSSRSWSTTLAMRSMPIDCIAL